MGDDAECPERTAPGECRRIIEDGRQMRCELSGQSPGRRGDQEGQQHADAQLGQRLVDEHPGGAKASHRTDAEHQQDQADLGGQAACS
ncbi:hypothetical protein ACFSHP_22135 [Novosphingobium panipatense]